ncbi:hypothetical protein [Natrinema soli]|uniref:Uncharacterized protein n=1 Tax=Natrinema soli TaxID=1930624 RepID=A0ABD5SV01_9EURY|nr:hypothetical protein [Natrinema soli]
MIVGADSGEPGAEDDDRNRGGGIRSDRASDPVERAGEQRRRDAVVESRRRADAVI